MTYEQQLNQQIATRTLDQWSQHFQDYMRQIDADFDPGHRIDHLQRVYSNALRLASIEGGLLAVIVPAAWLHDCVPVSKKSSQRSAASRLSAQQATALLKQWGYPAQYHEAIAHAIAAHSFSAGIPPETKEAQILRDADRLDALGAIGLARVMMLGGQFGNALYAVDEPFPLQRECDDKTYIIDHFYTKLLQLPQSMCTQSGRKEALKRKEFMRDYLATLAEELGLTRDSLPLEKE